VNDSNCAGDVLRNLARDKDQNVRSAVAYNENCPEDLLRKLTRHKTWHELQMLDTG
jgi:hypothetical protein